VYNPALFPVTPTSAISVFLLTISYDGEGIGDYQQEAQQPISGFLRFPQWATGNPMVAVNGVFLSEESGGITYPGVIFSNSSFDAQTVRFNLAVGVRTGPINKPPSYTVGGYISF
jgi:hypothetical protein